MVGCATVLTCADMPCDALLRCIHGYAPHVLLCSGDVIELNEGAIVLVSYEHIRCKCMHAAWDLHAHGHGSAWLRGGTVSCATHVCICMHADTVHHCVC